MPKVFIGMPVYNGEAYVEEAVRSLQAQSYPNFKLLISDNCSTDGTGDICEALAKEDNRIEYVRQEKNIQSIPNFRFLLNEADCEYFMWACHDDRWDPNFIEETLSVMESDPNIGLCFTGMIIRDLKSGDETRYLTGFTTQKRQWFKYIFRTIQGSANLIYGLHRTSLIKTFPLESYDYYDVLLGRWYELISNVVIIPKPLFVTGTDGVRIPYSLTGRKIDPDRFFKEETQILKTTFPIFWPALAVWSRLVLLMTRPSTQT